MLDTAHPAVSTLIAQGVIDDIGRLLASGSPPEAVVSGIEHMYEHRLDRTLTRIEWPVPRLFGGATPEQAHRMISGILSWHDGPATPVFARLAGVPEDDIAMTGIRGADRPADTDAAGLGCDPRDCLHERTATMTAPGLEIASTRLLLVRDRIAPAALARILAGESCGTALAPYGMWRGQRDTDPRWDPDRIKASAVLYIGKTPVGRAAEEIGPGFIAHVAKTAAG